MPEIEPLEGWIVLVLTIPYVRSISLIQCEFHMPLSFLVFTVASPEKQMLMKQQLSPGSQFMPTVGAESPSGHILLHSLLHSVLPSAAVQVA